MNKRWLEYSGGGEEWGLELHSLVFCHFSICFLSLLIPSSRPWQCAPTAESANLSHNFLSTGWIRFCCFFYKKKHIQLNQLKGIFIVQRAAFPFRCETLCNGKAFPRNRDTSCAKKWLGLSFSKWGLRRQAKGFSDNLKSKKQKAGTRSVCLSHSDTGLCQVWRTCQRSHLVWNAVSYRTINFGCSDTVCWFSPLFLRWFTIDPAPVRRTRCVFHLLYTGFPSIICKPGAHITCCIPSHKRIYICF